MSLFKGAPGKAEGTTQSCHVADLGWGRQGPETLGILARSWREIKAKLLSAAPVPITIPMGA